MAPTISPLDARLRETIHYAFQPIVNAQSGDVYGFEALLCGFDALGFANARSLLDHAHELGLTVETDRTLREMAVRSFAAFAGDMPARLFFNMDNRVLYHPSFQADNEALLRRHALSEARFCIEFSEVHAIAGIPALRRALATSGQRPLFLIDDFGTGYSSLRLLQEARPDLIKIDRCFITGSDTDRARKAFLAQLVELAQIQGAAVIAKGVETEGEFRVCREVGCQFVQGDFIAPATTETTTLTGTYPVVAESNSRNRRARQDPGAEIRAELDAVPPLRDTSAMLEVAETFRRDRSRSFFPVVDALGWPVGILREEPLKELVYSQYGMALLANRSGPFRIQTLLTPCLVCDITTPVPRILSAVAAREDDAPTILVENGRYLGVLHKSAIIRLMNERTLAQARNENPLTHLPGNACIEDHIAKALDRPGEPHVFAYFDFNNFKPFNDLFGFRRGDRVILLFAELLRRWFPGTGPLLGHIGGDDFVLGLPGELTDEVRQSILSLLERFHSDVETFYDPEARKEGFVEATDRSGAPCRVPLLSVSCGVVALQPGWQAITGEALSQTLAEVKSKAKRSPLKFCARLMS
ncbi:MAG TPA: GGDEF domain-containing protein [Acetobacteraceae bacterium]|nr:GGDEF domain-containing protein [Acetobacteraceae bacterium]